MSMFLKTCSASFVFWSLLLFHWIRIFRWLLQMLQHFTPYINKMMVWKTAMVSGTAHQHTSRFTRLQLKYLKLVWFVLEKLHWIPRYWRCISTKAWDSNGNIFFQLHMLLFLQVMIWLEKPIVNEFCRLIVLYKRYIDDILLIWSGSSAELCKVCARFGNTDANINLEGQGTQSVTYVIDPTKIFQHQLHSVNFLDLDIQSLCSIGFSEFVFRIYRKPGNAYYQPMCICLGDPTVTTQDAFFYAGSTQNCTDC